jgi:predicted permease
MGKLIFSITLVVVGIGIGYGIQVMVSKKRIALPIEKARRSLQKAALLFFNPIAILGATWVADIRHIKIAALPFLGMAALFTGGFLALGASRVLNLNRRQTGSFVVCGGFTNIGSLGALFCFIFLGEAGFALVPFYKLFEELSYYAIGFPVAKSFSDDLSQTPSFIRRLKNAVTDIFVLVAVSSIAIGLMLNLSGIPRASFYGTVNMIFIPLAALLLLISIGMAMRFSSVKHYFRPGIVVAAIKFAFVPLIVAGLGYLLGLQEIDGGLPLKVTLILSSMPVGFIAMVPPTIYNLDVDLSNSCWLITNGWLIVQIPILLVLTHYFFLNRYSSGH